MNKIAISGLKLVRHNAPVNWNPHLPPSRARVGDSGGMEALLNKIVAQGGGVIDNYWTPTKTCWGQRVEFDMQRRNW